MSDLKVGDLIRDNLGREGIVLDRSRAPGAKWLAEQDDIRMRNAAGPWWNVAPLDGGGVLVPEDLTIHLRRASVDDVAKVMESDTTDDGHATFLFLFAKLRSTRGTRSKAKGKKR